MEPELGVYLSIFSSGLIGSVATGLGAFFIKLYSVRRRTDVQLMETATNAAAVERQALFNDAQKIRAELQQQILDLRREVLDLQKENLRYVRENTVLQQQVIHLTRENAQWHERVKHLEAQVERINTTSATTDIRVTNLESGQDVQFRVEDDALDTLRTAG